MEKNIFKKLFLYFLNAENIRIKFFICRNERTDFDWVYQNFHKCEPSEYIHSAFYWEDTIDGYDYWQNIDYKWKETLSRCKRLNKN